MEEENKRGDNLNTSNGNLSFAERNDYGALRCILSKMEFEDLLKARLVCHSWKDEADYYILRRIKGIDFTNDFRLQEFFDLERTIYPPINLNLETISAQILAKYDLEGTKEVLLKGIDYLRYMKTREQLALDWAEMRNIKEKIFNLLLQPNNVNSLTLVFNYPVNLTDTEADLVCNFVNLHTLSIHHLLYCLDFGPNDIGTILVNRCPNLKYLNFKLQNISPFIGLSHLPLLVLMLNGRRNNGHSNPILSVLPKLFVDLPNSQTFTELANIGPQFESLELLIRCLIDEDIWDQFEERNRNYLIQLFGAVETLLKNTSGCLEQIKLEFKGIKNEYLRKANGLRLNIPSLPKVQNFLLDGFPGGSPCSCREPYNSHSEPSC